MRSVLLMSVFSLLFYKSIKHTYRHLDFIYLFEYNLNMFTKENCNKFEFHLHNLQRNFRSILSIYYNCIYILCSIIFSIVECWISVYHNQTVNRDDFSLYSNLELKIITSSYHRMYN